MAPKLIVYLSTILGLISLFTVYYATPPIDHTFLVESLRYVQPVATDKEYGFRLLKILDYDY